MVNKAMIEIQSFDRAALEFALTELGRRSYEAGRTMEIAIYGWSALLLTLNRQVNTHDVDAVFEKDKDFVKKLTAEMAVEFGWDKNWLNDGVKGWLSAIEPAPAEPQGGASIVRAPPEPPLRVKVT